MAMQGAGILGRHLFDVSVEAVGQLMPVYVGIDEELLFLQHAC